MLDPRKPEFLFLQQEDVAACGGADMSLALAAVERVHRLLADGKVRQPVKTVMGQPRPPETRRYLMAAMPAYLDLPAPQGPISGVKWAAESADNAEATDGRLLPYGIDVLVLHDHLRAVPLAIMDASLITATRTAASAGLLARHLARRGARKVGIVGAGAVGRRVIEAIGLAVPSVTEMVVFDSVPERAAHMRSLYGERWKVTPVLRSEDAIRGVDIVTTQTSTVDAPFVRAEHLDPGSLYIHTGINEAHDDVYLGSSKIVSDEPEMFDQYPYLAVSRLRREGRLDGSKVVPFSDVLHGRATGRESDREILTAIPFGIGSVDLMIAREIYDRAVAEGRGQTLRLWNDTDLVLSP